jgi:hypothetical protein
VQLVAQQLVAQQLAAQQLVDQQLVAQQLVAQQLVAQLKGSVKVESLASPEEWVLCCSHAGSIHTLYRVYTLYSIHCIVYSAVQCTV